MVYTERNCKNAIRLRLQVNQHAVKQIFADGTFREFQSLAEAQCTTQIDSRNIRAVCQGLRVGIAGNM